MKIAKLIAMLLILTAAGCAGIIDESRIVDDDAQNIPWNEPSDSERSFLFN